MFIYIGVRDLPLRDMLSLGAWRMGLGFSGKILPPSPPSPSPAPFYKNSRKYTYIYIYIYTVFHLNKIDLNKFRTSGEQSTSAKRSDANKRSNKVPPQRNTHFWQAPGNFEQGRRTSGRTRSNKDVEQAVEQGSNKRRTRSNKRRTSGRTSGRTRMPN